MKDFQEFIETITLEDYDTIMFSANQAMVASGKKDEYALSFFIHLELLERYHNWLHSE